MEFKPVRRQDREISPEEAMDILQVEEYGVLATVGEDGLPCGVPLSYVVDGGGVYFHCAKAGQKVDNMTYQPRVSFIVVGPTEPVYCDGNFSNLYESAVVHGMATRVEEDAEKVRILQILCKKYFPGHMDKFENSLTSLPALDVWRISIDRLSGKARR